MKREKLQFAAENLKRINWKEKLIPKLTYHPSLATAELL